LLGCPVSLAPRDLPQVVAVAEDEGEELLLAGDGVGADGIALGGIQLVTLEVDDGEVGPAQGLQALEPSALRVLQRLIEVLESTGEIAAPVAHEGEIDAGAAGLEIAGDLLEQVDRPLVGDEGPI